MDIRTKALAGIMAILVLFMIVLTSVSSSIILANYEKLEASEVDTYTSLVVSNIGSELEFLATLAEDWGECNETYAFLEGTNPDHVIKKYSQEKFAKFDYDFVILTDRNGTIRFSQGNDKLTGINEAVPDSLVAAVTAPEYPFRTISVPFRSGYFIVPERGGPALVAASPVQQVGRTGDPNGVLLIGRYLSQADIAKYRTDAIPYLSVTAVGPDAPPQHDAGGDVTRAARPLAITEINETMVRGVTTLPDIYGENTVLVTIEIPRTVMMQGKNTLVSSILFELATGLIIAVFVFLLIDRMVLSRVQDLSADIRAIAPTGRVSGRVQSTKDDEISRLADATNQMLAEIEMMQTRLLESEAKLVRAEKVAGFGHWEFDMVTRAVTASVGARIIYGMEERDYSISEIQAFPLPEYRGHLDAALHDLIEKGTPYNVEFAIRRPDNDRIVAIRSLAEYDPARRRVFGVIQDITLQKQAEREVRESEERYRLLMESIPEMVLVHRKGTILYVNEALVRAVGISREELIGSMAFRFIAPESMTIITQKIQLREEGGSPGPFEAVFLASNNERRHGRVNTAAILYGGEPASLVIITDITSRKIMEETLSTANKKLRMLSSITRHDIRNKILGLRAYLAIGMESAGKDTALSLFRQMDDIARTIDEQIEFTREYQTMGVHTPQWIPVGETIGRVITQLYPKGIEIRNETGRLELYADPLLGKVFYNLFDNAIRYGDTITEIRIYCEEHEGRLFLFIEDNGVGIPPEDKLDIFERGFGKNTGLGLFMIREILGITGITIRETGIFGKGARFEMLVPEEKFRFRADEQPEKTDGS